MEYHELRTGMTYRDVYAMLWSGSDNPEDWRYKRRHTVLGFWHELKLSMWQEHLYMCEKQAEYEAEQAEDEDEVPF